MDVLVVFDDTNPKSEAIRDVIGEKGFADVIVKKHRLEDYYRGAVRSLYPQARWKTVHSAYEFRDLLDRLPDEGELRVLHCYSHFIFTERAAALPSFQKLKYAETPYRGMVGDAAAILLFNGIKPYRAFLKAVSSGSSSLEAAKSIQPSFPIDGMVDIGKFENFIQCITGSFDSRYFNSVTGSRYTLVKRSTDKRKIKAEYTYYHLLPDDMKTWFVMPYDYREDEDGASYTMEHLHMTDLAIKWVHGSIGEEEFRQILEQYFHFFAHRHAKPVSPAAYRKTADALYVDKVKKRIGELKQCEGYHRIAAMLAAGGQESIDDLAARYFALKERIESRHPVKSITVIGHGDPCFANTLYSKTAQMMKFIDPKGALTEEELWTDPYYDIAKLSHSICGLYDFFNNGLFDIHMDENFRCDLTIEFDNRPYVALFRETLAENGYDFLLVRLYEASLFLSMLPLHMDNPFKVFGFILNAGHILQEIEHEI